MKNLTSILCLLCALMLAHPYAHAGDISIVTLDTLPYGNTEKGKTTGLAYELGDTIIAKAGLSSTNRLVSPSKIVRAFEMGKADMVIMPSDTDIEEAADNIGPVFSTETVILGRAGTVIRSTRDLRGKRVAVVRDSGYDTHAARNDKFIPVSVDSYSRAIKLLLAGQVSAVAGVASAMAQTIRKDAFPAQAFGTPLGLSVSHANLFLSRNVDKNTRSKILAALNALCEDGTINALVGKYSL